MASEKWDIDGAHSNIAFSVRHMVVAKVHGRFTKFTGELGIDPENPSNSKVQIAIDVASISTNEEKRDGHLRSPDFFDAEKHPKIEFASTAVERTSQETLRVKGNLTIHGVTKPVTLEVEQAGPMKDPWGNTRLGFHAKTKIDRKEFGLTWNQVLEAGGLLVGDQIDIAIDLEATKAKAA